MQFIPPPSKNAADSYSMQSDTSQYQSPRGNGGGGSRLSARLSAFRPKFNHEVEYDTVYDSFDEEENKIGLVTKVGNMGGKQMKRVKKQVLKKHATERAIMCFLAVSLLWLTSLPVARAIVSALIGSPTIPAVVADVQRAFNITNQQRTDYSECASRIADSCNTTFYEHFELEKQAVREAESRNWERIVQYNITANECRKHLVDGIARFQPGISRGTIQKKLPAEGICEVVEEALERNGGAGVTGTYTLVDTHTKESNEAVYGFSDSMQKRVDYDKQYLEDTATRLTGANIDIDQIANSPEEAFRQVNDSYTQMMACVAPDETYNGVKCTSDTSLLKDVRKIRDDANSAYNDASQKLNDIQSTANEQLRQFKAFMKEFEKVREEISNQLNYNLPVIDSAIINGPDFDVQVLGLEMKTPEELYEEFKKEQIDPYEQKIGDAQQTAEETVQGVKDVSEELKDPFSDYNPPPVVNSTEFISEWDKNNEEFNEQLADQLKQVLLEENEIPGEDSASSQKSQELANNLLTKLDPREWSFYAYSPDLLDQLIDGISQFSSILLRFDVVYRILRSLQLIRKYWNISAVSTPPADIRVDSSKKGQIAPPMGRNPAQNAAYWLTHPAVNALFFMIFLGVFVAAFVYLYTPIYNEYTNNCVAKSWQEVGNEASSVSNGTMLYRNAYTVAYQYAASEGDQITTSNIDRLNVGRDLVCRDEFTRSSNVLNEHEFYFNQLSINQRGVYSDGSALGNCYTFSGVDADLEEYITPGRSRWPSQCTATFIGLEDSLYNCAKVDPCDSICAGPNEEVIRAATHRASCISEWYMHSLILGSFLAGLTYVLMNISRYYMLKAIVQLNFKHLATNRYQYIGSCTDNGELLYPESVTVDGMSFKSAIRKELQVALRRFKRTGMLILVASIFINIPWILMLALYSGNLSYPH